MRVADAIARCLAGDAGAYRVVVSNAVGTATSSDATLSVILGPVITTQPVSATVAPGANVQFNVTASGTAPLHYQWQRNGENLQGETNAVLLLNNVQLTTSGLYRVVVGNGAGVAESVLASLQVSLETLYTFSDQFAGKALITGLETVAVTVGNIGATR